MSFMQHAIISRRTFQAGSPLAELGWKAMMLTPQLAEIMVDAEVAAMRENPQVA